MKTQVTAPEEMDQKGSLYIYSSSVTLLNKYKTDLTSISLEWKAFPETITESKQSNYRLMEIGKDEDYFDQEIQYQQSLTNKLSKY